MEPPETVEYRGVIYKRNPESAEWPKRVYYQAPRGSERGYLHRDIYKDVHGQIPDGAHIHHKDFDPFNNDSNNLVALSPTDHQKLHREQNGKFDEARMEIHRATTLIAAARWHGSPEGLAWHREQAKRGWEGREPDGKFVCPACQKEHEGFFANRSARNSERYCSNTCRQRELRRSGKEQDYMEDAICPVCGTPFKRWRTKGVKTCSRSCGAKLRWSTR